MSEDNMQGSNSGRVAVIDDEPEIGDLVRRIFKGHFEVDIYVEPQKALDALDGGARYDAILCDLYMPGLSGRQVYDEILKRWPEMSQRVVFMSGMTSAVGPNQDLEGLTNITVAKPFRLEELRRVVYEVVTDAQAMGRPRAT